MLFPYQLLITHNSLFIRKDKEIMIIFSVMVVMFFIRRFKVVIYEVGNFQIFRGLTCTNTFFTSRLVMSTNKVNRDNFDFMQTLKQNLTYKWEKCIL